MNEFDMQDQHGAEEISTEESAKPVSEPEEKAENIPEEAVSEDASAADNNDNDDANADADEAPEVEEIAAEEDHHEPAEQVFVPEQEQQAPQPSYQYQPYQNMSQGYYRPQTNEYVYAPQPAAPKKKKNAGKAILIAITAVLTVFIVAVGSIGGYTLFQRISNPPQDSLKSKVPIEQHQFTNKAEEENVIEDYEPENEEVDEEVEEFDDNAVESVKTPLRDYPTLEQLATPDDAMSIPDIYDKVSPSVVGISAKVSRGTQLGSGFIISDDGYVVTNAHVIDGYISSVTVVDGGMNEYEAEVIGSDEQSDIAVLKIDPSQFDLTPVEFGKSSDLRIGELAIAIGNPLGFELYGTMTTGIISGLNRTVTIDDNTMTLMQTSAAINNGNSGGPLIDAYGRVVGITSAKINSVYGESLGFAIPIDEALPIITNLIEYGYVTGRPSIGISGKDITEIISMLYGLPQGIQVYTITEGSGAQKAGIMPGDVIIGIDGETVTGMDELSAIKNRHKVGDTVTVTIYRPISSEWSTQKGESFDVEVVLGEASPDPQ